MGPRDGPNPEGGSPGKERGRKRRGGAGKRGKIVATRCQILRLKCEDALYKYTDLFTYIIGCANFVPDWPLLLLDRTVQDLTGMLT